MKKEKQERYGEKEELKECEGEYVAGSEYGAKRWALVFIPNGWRLVQCLEGQSEAQYSQVMMRKLRSQT